MDGDEKKNELSKLMSIARDKSSATPANDCFDTPIADLPTSLPLSLANNNQSHPYSQPYYHQSLNYNTGAAPTHASYSCAASEQTRTHRRDISSRPLASSMSVTADVDKRTGASLGGSSLPSTLFKGGNLRVDHAGSGEALALSTSPSSLGVLIGSPVPPNCPPPRHPSKRDRLSNNGSFFRGVASLATSVAKRPRRGFLVIVFLVITIMILTAVTTASLHSTQNAVAGYSNRNGVIISPRISLLEHESRPRKNTLEGQLENKSSHSTQVVAPAQEGVTSTQGISFTTEVTLQTSNLALYRADNPSREITMQSTSIIVTAGDQPPLGARSMQTTQSTHLNVNRVSSTASTQPQNLLLLNSTINPNPTSSELDKVIGTESEKAEEKVINDSYSVDIYGGKKFVGHTLMESGEEWAHQNGRVAVDPFWDEQVINASKRISELGSAMLASAARDLLAAATHQRTRGDLHREIIDLRDAVEMEVNDGCTDNEESFFADTHNNNSDCGMLQTEFGMCHSYALIHSNKNETYPSAFNALGESPEAMRIIDAEIEKALKEKRKPLYSVPPLTAEEEADLVASSGHQNRRLQTKDPSGRVFTKADMYAFRDLDLVKTPYAQGYVTVKGLEDPVDVGAAMLDEYRRIERGESIEWPLAGVHASIDGTRNDTNEEEYEDVSSDFRAPSARTSPFERKPYTIDFVYTEVDFSETTFQADRFAYKDRLFKPRAAGKPSPNDIRLGSEKAAHVLPFVWSHLPDKTDPEVLSALTKRFEAASEKMIAKGLYNLEKGPSNASTVAEAFARLPRALYAQALSVSDEANRFRNFNELRYSLRSINRYIIQPMERWIERLQQAKQQGNQVGRENKVFGRYAFGKIYIIVSHKTQMPPWMQEHERIVLVEHRDLFPVPSKSLPTFNSNAIESVIHRIPNLSRHYIYFNNDFMLARPVTFFDFFQPYVVWGGAANEPPTVKWLPKIMSCEAYQADRFGKNPKWNWKLSPRQVRTVLDVGKMIGPLPLGFAISFSHIPQMYDKLQVMRVMTEPSVRRKVCHTRAARERLDTTLPIMYAYQHFALLWRHGWGPEAGRRASKEIFGKNYIDKLFPQNRSHIPWTDFVDSRGRNRVIFWDYMTGIAELLPDGFAPTPTQGAKQRMVKNMNLTSDIREVSIPIGAHFLKENELSGVERKLSVVPASLAIVKYPTNVSQENYAARRIMSVLAPLAKGANRILRRGITETLLMPTRRLLDATIRMHSAQANQTHANVEVVEVDVLMGPLERPKTPAYFDHWFLDLVRSARDPIVGLIRSKLAFFGMGERSASLVEHKATLRRWKETNSVLFVTENDDMPVGSRDPSPHGFFGNMPKYLISRVCGLHASYWENSTTTAFSRGLVQARMLSTKSSGSNLHDVSEKDDLLTRNGNELVLANSSRKTVLLVVRNAARAPSAYFNINVDSVNAALEAFATSNFADYFRRYDLLVLRKKMTQVAAPSPSAIERMLGKLIASRIAVACRLEEAATAIEAMETSVREYDEIGAEEDSKAKCPLGSRFSDRAAHEKREKEIQTFRRRYSVQPSGPPPIPRGQSTRNPALDFNYGSQSEKYDPPRHNCDLVPLAKSEVPPTADVHGVDIFFDIIRTAVGDCDSSKKTQHKQPAWEREGC